MNFDQRIFQFIEKNKLIYPRGKVLVGVSGGADSMALLLSLERLRHQLGAQLHVLHFNHRFRPEALRDERFVVKWCRHLNIPVTVGCRTGGKIKHLSEDDARQMRFKFFIKSALECNAQSVALAHTRNDLAETVLMRLMRGSGLYGLRAILPRRNINGVSFVRPLMGVNRQDVEKYLKDQKVPFCTDVTNRLKSYERNRLRIKLLPLLAREYNPQIIDVLSDLAVSAGDDYEFLSMQALKQFEKCAVILKNRIKINIKSAQRQHPAILRLMFRQMVEKLTKDQAVLGFEHIQAMEHLLASNAGGTLVLPQQLRVTRTQKFLELYYA